VTEPRHAPPSHITPERWALLEPHIDALLELAPDARGDYVARVTATDEALGAALAQLVNDLDRDSSLLAAAGADRSRLLAERPSETSANLLERLQRSFGASYLLERELGGGGMSRVFVAQQAGLDRKVVIKVLAPGLAATISADRFEREIKLAASLQQANIVPLLSAGNAADLPYYTMPLVDGQSLRDRLMRDGRLPVGEAISVLRDVARALAYAHERGIVHRDIKPGNVLLSGGTAVVTDFGIAKALGAASAAGEATTAITVAGTGIGTPAYMSPEQASGDPNADHRTDLYAFGCLAYDVFTGQPPFHGNALHRIVAAHFHDTPVPLRERRDDVPPAIEGLVAQCLEKNPDRRPQHARDLLLVLDAANSQPVVAPTRTRSRRTRTIAAGLAVAAAAAAAFAIYNGSRGSSGTAVDPMLFSALPFENVARDTSLEYRVNGISDELMTAVARVPGIRITGRSAALQFEGERRRDVRGAARALGARLLVTGNLRERNGRIIVSAQLNDSLVAGELWSDTFDRDEKTISSVTDDIAREIVAVLRARYPNIVTGAGRPPRGVGTNNPEAHDRYLLGQELVRHRGNAVLQGVEELERAISLDSNYAQAYAALAKALELYPYFNGTPPAEINDRVTTYARRALAIDSTVADAYAALAWTEVNTGRYDRATAEFRRAIAVEPDNVDARVAYGRFLVVFGSSAEALVQLDSARKGDPLSPVLSAWASYALFLEGRVDSALAENGRAVQLAPGLLPVANLGSLIDIATGHPEEARRLAASDVPVGAMTNAPYLFAKLGDTATAMRMIRRLETSTPRPWFTDVSKASVMLAIGDTAAALAGLDASMASSGAAWIQFTPVRDPTFDAVRGSPHFASILKRANLDVRVLTSRRVGRAR
jgi:serine/threonine protein kinase/tetratricopeptide (TPR) repeat protein